MPAASYPHGTGRIVHPTLGAFDYEAAPDEWTNIDGDVVVLPTFSATKTLQGAATSLWNGDIRSVICEERWLSLGGLAMPVGQLRAILACAMNPVDPAVAYMQWYPTYTTSIGYQAILLDVVIGSAGRPGVSALSGFNSQSLVLNDLVNALDENGNVYGWVDKPVTLYWKMVSRIAVNG